MNIFDKLANPGRFQRITAPVMPYCLLLAGLSFAAGLYYALFASPADYQQGETVRIMYVHVPSAWLALSSYLGLGICALFFLIWRHPLADIAARAIAPIGCGFAGLTLVTGSLWGYPTWGTWWVWDPRLTSFLILFLFYLGYIALWEAIEDSDTAADLTAVLCMVGSVFAGLSRSAVNFWNQGLHQGTSIPVATGERSVADVFFAPLLISMVGFGLLFLALTLYRTGTEIRLRRTKALLAREGRS